MKTKIKKTTQVRGVALKEKMQESFEQGKEFRKHNPENLTQKSRRGHKQPKDKLEIERQTEYALD